MNNIQNIKSETPLISICCLAYNMEKYIRQSLESLLMQSTTFPFEIIIHDDASTDNTREIIKEYALKHPAIITTIFQKENMYSKSRYNFQYKDVFPNAKGKYIAYCDGDDYWIDPLKLQKQVAFLESNSDYGLVHTRAVIYSEAKNKFNGAGGFHFEDFEELITECTVVHSSTCYSNSLLKQYIKEVKPQEHTNWASDDFPMWLWFIQNSKVKLLDDITTVYNERNGSISHIGDDLKRLVFTEGVYEIVDYYLAEGPDLQNEKKIRARYYSGMIKMYFLTHQWSGIWQSTKIFYKAHDWVNLLWIAITLPFSFSNFLIKVTYRIRSMVFNLFNIYPIKK